MEVVKIKYKDKIGRTTTKTIIKTECDYCGIKFDYNGGLSHYNRTKNHYCGVDCQKKVNRKHGYSGTYEYDIWCNASRRAKRKGIEFNIEPSDIVIPDKCLILNIDLIKNETDCHGPKDNSPSLDRINNNEGYIKGNIRIISNRANRIKADSSMDEIEKIYKDYIKLKTDGRI